MLFRSKSLPAVEKLAAELKGDEKIGAQIILRALLTPSKSIAANAGYEGSVVVEKILASKESNYGFNADSEEYVDLVEAGVIDPAKVSRTALQNAASISGLLLTTEVLVTEIKEKDAPMPPMPPGGGMY